MWILLLLLFIAVVCCIIKYIYIPTTHLKLNEDIRDLGTTLRRQQRQLESTKSALLEKSKQVDTLQATVKRLVAQLDEARQQDDGKRDSENELDSTRRENTELSAKIRTLESTVCSVQKQLTETQSANLELVSRLRNEAARSQRMNSIDQLRLQHNDLSSLVVLAPSPPPTSMSTVAAAAAAPARVVADGDQPNDDRKEDATTNNSQGGANSEQVVVDTADCGDGMPPEEEESLIKMTSVEDNNNSNDDDRNNPEENDAHSDVGVERSGTESREGPPDDTNDHHQVEESEEAGDEPVVADNDDGDDDPDVVNVQAERVEPISEGQEEPSSDQTHDRSADEPANDEIDHSPKKHDREFHLATANLTGQHTSTTDEGEQSLSNENEPVTLTVATEYTTTTDLETAPLDTPSTSAAVEDDRPTPALDIGEEVNAETTSQQEDENEGATTEMQRDVKNTLDHLALNPDLSIDEDEDKDKNKSESGSHRNAAAAASASYSPANAAVERSVAEAEGNDEAEPALLKVYRNPWEHAIHPICTRGNEGMATAALGPSVNDVSLGVFAQTDVRYPQI